MSRVHKCSQSLEGGHKPWRFENIWSGCNNLTVNHSSGTRPARCKNMSCGIAKVCFFISDAFEQQDVDIVPKRTFLQCIIRAVFRLWPLGKKLLEVVRTKTLWIAQQLWRLLVYLFIYCFCWDDARDLNSSPCDQMNVRCFYLIQRCRIPAVFQTPVP